METDKREESELKAKEMEIPVFTVLKNDAILKNIFLLDKPPSIPPSSSSLEFHSNYERESPKEETLLVGRHPDCNITLEHPSISRFHLRIHSNPPSHSLSVVDLYSVHGTWISGKKIVPGVMVELKEGDTMQLGGSRRLYRLHWLPITRAYDFDNPFLPPLDTTDAVQETGQGTSLDEDNLEGLQLLFADENLISAVQEMSPGRNNWILDPTVYTGLLGTAFTCLRSHEATANHRDLQLCVEIVDACAAVSHSSTRHVTFLCGRGGVYALGAVAANCCGDQMKSDFYLSRFLEMAEEKALPVGPEDGGFGMSYDLMYGRAGFLWAALFINKYLGAEAVPSHLLMPVVEAVLAGGRAGASDNTACPLMYRWHGTRYWGAAHGLAGILHVLLHFSLSNNDTDDVKETLRYMMSNRFPHSGNYPVSEGNPRDKLVQWSHGATGVAITLCKASEVLRSNRELRNAAIEAGEVVWKNGLLKKVGLADGSAGNAYTFLSLFRLTGERIYEERGKAFAGYLYHNVRETIADSRFDGDDNACSLFQGLAGAACLWFDMLVPEKSRFPGYEL